MCSLIFVDIFLTYKMRRKDEIILSKYAKLYFRRWLFVNFNNIFQKNTLASQVNDDVR